MKDKIIIAVLLFIIIVSLVSCVAVAVDDSVARVTIDGMPCLYTRAGGIACDWSKFDGNLNDYSSGFIDFGDR